MTVAEAIREATNHLSATSGTARLDAELLMAHAMGVSRSDMLIRHLSDAAPDVFATLIARRAQSEPVAHITGVQEFFGREFLVTPDTLIPRGDTETLIEAALELAPNARTVLDLGTGSGALLVTAMLELEAAKGVAIDASTQSLKIAERNGRRHGLDENRTHFFRRDWCEGGWADDLGTFDLILCNPPYVEEDAELDPDVRDYEPAGALFGGKEGLDDYRILIPHVRKLMKEDAVALFEIGHSQGGAVSKIAQNAGFSVEIRNDLANRPRCVVLR